MMPPGATNFISDAISRHGSKKYQNGHLCVSGLKLLATTVSVHATTFGSVSYSPSYVSKGQQCWCYGLWRVVFAGSGLWCRFRTGSIVSFPLTASRSFHGGEVSWPSISLLPILGVFLLVWCQVLKHKTVAPINLTIWHDDCFSTGT